MTLLAGFDVVEEVDVSALAANIRSGVMIDATPASPPFEIVRPIPGSFASGAMQMIVSSVDLEPIPGDILRLVVEYTCWTIELTTPVGAGVYGLAGSWYFDIDGSSFVSIAPNGTATIGLVPGSIPPPIPVMGQSDRDNLDAWLGSVPGAPDIAAFLALAGATIQTALNQSLPLAFDVVTVDPSQDGLYGTVRRFVSLESHVLSESGTLGLFGILIRNRVGQGDVSTKTLSIVPQGAAVASLLSPKAFERIIFCPAIASSYQMAQNDLPAPCGSGSIELTDLWVTTVELTRIQPSFKAGWIQVDVEGGASTICADLSIRARADLTLSLSPANAIVPTLKTYEPAVDLDVPWLCKVASFALGGSAALGIVLGLEAVANLLLDSYGFDVPSQNFPAGSGALLGGTMTSVTVSPEGLLTGGTLPVPPFVPRAVPGVAVTKTLLKTQKQVIATGTYHHIAEKCLGGDYAWTEQYNTVSRQFIAVPTLLCRPVSYSWLIGIDAVPLEGPEGSVLIAAFVWHESPPDVPQLPAVKQDVTVHWSRDGATLTLTNEPTDGNYVLPLELTATDAHGDAYTVAPPYGVAGHTVEMPGFDARLLHCAGIMAKESLRKVPAGNPFEQAEPDPAKLLTIVPYLRDLENEEALDLANQFERRHAARLSLQIFGHARVLGGGPAIRV